MKIKHFMNIFIVFQNVLIINGEDDEVYEVRFKTEECFNNDPNVKNYQVVNFPFDPENELTICMWVLPFRYEYDQMLLRVMPKLYISLHLDYLAVEYNEWCQDIFDQFVFSSTKWTHICILSSTTNQIYFNHSYLPEGNCNATGAHSDYKNSYLLLGGDPMGDVIPFEGKLADIRVYPYILSKDQLDEVANIKTNVGPKEYILNEQINSTKCLTSMFVPVRYIHGIYLDKDSVMFKKKRNFTESEMLCQRFGALLPSNNIQHLYHIIILQSRDNPSQKNKFFWAAKDNNDMCQMATLKYGKIYYKKSNCSEFTYTLCIMSKDTHLKLIGFPFEDNKFHFGFSTGKVFVEYQTRIDIFRLKLIKNELELHYVKDKEEKYGYTIISKEDDVVGRHKWHLDYYLNQTHTMTFSSCDEESFTCSNGDCIPIEKACDFKIDCLHDGFDEKVCEPGMKSEIFYEPLLAPIPYGKNKAHITLILTLDRIVTLDLSNLILKLAVNLTVTWIDHRLRFKFLGQDAKLIDNIIYKEYWHPDIYIKQAISKDREAFYFRKNPGIVLAQTENNGSFDYYESYEVLRYEGKDVLLTHEKTHDISLLCNFELFLYPFDIQVCSFTLELRSSLKDDVEWDSNGSFIKLASDISLSLYEDLYFEIDKIKHNKALVIFSVSRKYGSFLFNMFLPCVILDVIGIMTHMLPIEVYSDRITVTLSCLIVMAALFTQLSSSLPTSAEPKLIDIWMFVHVALLFLVFIIQIIVISLNNNKEKQKDNDKKENQLSTLFFKLDSKNPNQSKLDDKVLMAWTSSVSQNTFISDVIANKIGFILCTVIYLTFLTGFILTIFYYKSYGLRHCHENN